MIPATVLDTFESVGAAASGVCTMNSTSHLQNMFLGMIYTNPLHALVRELLCNAVDSHIQAGNQDTPVQITVPEKSSNVLNESNSFVIRDFGVGITHQQFLEIYADLGGSTKRTDSAVTGSLGLGSKSPLGYADLFNLACYDGSEVRHYLISRNERRELIWQLMGTVESDQPRGVEVSVPIKRNDINSLHTHVANILAAFNHPCMPQVAIPSCNIPDLAVATNWEDYNLITANVAFEHNQHRASKDYSLLYMGNVAYRVKLHDIVVNASAEVISNATKQLLQDFLSAVKTTMFVPLSGDNNCCPIDFDAGRYNIQATTRSSDWLCTKLIDAANKDLQRYIDSIDSEPNNLKKLSKILDLYVTTNKQIWSLVAAKLKKTKLADFGLRFDQSSMLPLTCALTDKTAYGNLYCCVYNCWQPVTTAVLHKKIAQRCLGVRGHIYSYSSVFQKIINELVNTGVLIVDDPFAWRKRVAAYYVNVAHESMYIVGQQSTDRLVKMPADDKRKLIAELQSLGVKYICTSDMPAPNVDRVAGMASTIKDAKKSAFDVNNLIYIDKHYPYQPTSLFIRINEKQLKNINDTDRFLLVPLTGFRPLVAGRYGADPNGWTNALDYALEIDFNSASSVFKAVLAFRPAEIPESDIPVGHAILHKYVAQQFELFKPLLEYYFCWEQLCKLLNDAGVASDLVAAKLFNPGNKKVCEVVEWIYAIHALVVTDYSRPLRIATTAFSQFLDSPINATGSERPYATFISDCKEKYLPVSEALVNGLLMQYPLLPHLPTHDRNHQGVITKYLMDAHVIDNKAHVTLKLVPNLPSLTVPKRHSVTPASVDYFVELEKRGYAGKKSRRKSSPKSKCKTLILTAS